LVYYSLANVPDSRLTEQWVQSIRSLRLYNRTIPVWLFLYNGAHSALLREADRQNVLVHDLGSYPEFLRGMHAPSSVLALYPTFHKFLQLGRVPDDVEQVLYLDCDTFFFDDVNRLFQRYSAHDWYAREEPSSRRSHLEYDPSHVDEDLLEHIARSESLRRVLPFNSGVCLLNHRIWREWERLRVPYLDLGWRLLCGRELKEHDAPLEHDQEARQAVLASITDSDRARALPYPSQNTWIIEQISLWLALGHLQDFSLGAFTRSDVPQGPEFCEMPGLSQRCVLAHYYSNGEEYFFEAVPRIGHRIAS
jgi:hypothetical protein